MEWISITEIAEQTKIPRITVHRYVKNHRHYLQTKRLNRKILVASDSIPVIELIRRLYVDRGFTADRVEEHLSSDPQQYPATVTIPANENSTAVAKQMPLEDFLLEVRQTLEKVSAKADSVQSLQDTLGTIGRSLQDISQRLQRIEQKQQHQDHQKKRGIMGRILR